MPMFSPRACPSLLQDLGGIKTTWGTITAVGMNPYQGSAVPSTGRRLAQQQQSSSPLPAEGTKPVSVRSLSVCDTTLLAVLCSDSRCLQLFCTQTASYLPNKHAPMCSSL